MGRVQGDSWSSASSTNSCGTGLRFRGKVSCWSRLRVRDFGISDSFFWAGVLGALLLLVAVPSILALDVAPADGRTLVVVCARGLCARAALRRECLRRQIASTLLVRS